MLFCGKSIRLRSNRSHAAVICGACFLAGMICRIIAADEATVRGPFADFGFMPAPADYSGRVFHLSQQYPPTEPGADELPAFLNIDFRKDWRKYILAARDYCFEGNVGAKDAEDDFDVSHQTPVRWFHMPWQHFGAFGREGIHGLTKERRSPPVNWRGPSIPKGKRMRSRFTTASVAMRLARSGLFLRSPNCTKSSSQTARSFSSYCLLIFRPKRCHRWPIPSLGKAISPTASTPITARCAELLLIQMDLMVRDKQSPCGWVFGTFQYNGRLNRKNRWENLIPVGLQWGNDPNVAEHQVNAQPVKTVRNSNLKETVINEDDNELPPTHLGWNGRLNGPVDNPMSSCMSCHATAQVRVKSELSPLFQSNPPAPGSTEWMRWFKNYKCGERFDPDIPSADFSLQLAISVKNFQQWKGEASGVSAKNFEFLAGKTEKQLGPKFSDTIIEDGTPKEVPKIQRNIAE